MPRNSYVIDTHALLWYFAGDRRLSARAKRVLDEAHERYVDVLVPIIALAEALAVSEKQGTPSDMTRILAAVRTMALRVVDMDLDVLTSMIALPAGLELHDRSIAATALLNESVLITRDPAFEGVVRTYW